jgi:HD superfamily phosphodiesterase
MDNLNRVNTDFDFKINEVEYKWMPGIILFLEDLYNNKWLPSHDINHHRRVWKNAVQLLRNFITGQETLKDTFLDELIICCFFHDTGLLIDPGEFHGKESRLLAENFVSLRKKEVNFNVTELLEAIEKHDDKNYKESISEHNFLLEILSLSDDIDAFGIIGLYRYIEIYLVRGIDAEKIPELILSNAKKRYENLIIKLSKYGMSNDVFTDKYTRLVKLLTTDSIPDYPVSLVKWVDYMIVKPKRNPDQFLSLNEFRNIKDQQIRLFIEFYAEERKSSDRNFKI